MIGVAASVCALLCLMMLPQIVANLITKLLVGWTSIFIIIIYIFKNKNLNIINKYISSSSKAEHKLRQPLQSLFFLVNQERQTVESFQLG